MSGDDAAATVQSAAKGASTTAAEVEIAQVHLTATAVSAASMTRAYQDPHQNLIKSAIIIVVQDTRRLDLILHPNPLVLIHDPLQLIRKNSSGRWKMMWISVQGIKERPPLDGFLLLKLQKEKLTSLKERDGYRVSDRRCLILEPLQIITGLPILQRCLLHPTLQIQTFKDLVFVVNSVFDEKLRTVFEILF